MKKIILIITILAVLMVVLVGCEGQIAMNGSKSIEDRIKEMDEKVSTIPGITADIQKPLSIKDIKIPQGKSDFIPVSFYNAGSITVDTLAFDITECTSSDGDEIIPNFNIVTKPYEVKPDNYVSTHIYIKIPKTMEPNKYVCKIIVYDKSIGPEEILEKNNFFVDIS